MKTLHQAILICAVLILSTGTSFAETVRLKTGAILVGNLEVIKGGGIVITTKFPEEAEVRLKRDELEPRSLYDILDRRLDPKDPMARLELAGFAESNGLYGIAVADYMKVAELNPKLKKEMAKRVNGVREAIAEGILKDAKALLEEGNGRGALLYLHTIRERYGKTKAAKEAQKLMGTGHTMAGYSADVAKKTISASKAPKLIATIEKELLKGDKEARKLGGHAGDSSRDSKGADKAIGYFEKAWKKIKTLPVTVDDAGLQATIRHLRKTGKERLVKAYLTAGSIHLQRYSIPRAEEYCTKLCELEPNNQANHDLHRLIIQAKIYSGAYGGILR